MEEVSPEKLSAMNQAALDDTARGLAFLLRRFMDERDLRADQVEIVQEATPTGIRIFVRERQQTKEGETRDH